MPTDITKPSPSVPAAGRKCASSGSRWEPIMGSSRAGQLIAVTGTVGINAWNEL